MKVIRLFSYARQLRESIGLPATCRFALAYLRILLFPPRGNLASMPVGPYTFFFPSTAFFFSVFSEIFFHETYFIPATDAPLSIIDCGANIGVSLLYMKLRAPRASVICYEPNAAARAVLEHNICVNRWEREVAVLPYALGERDGVADFHFDKENSASTGGGLLPHEKHMRAAHGRYPVEVRRLSSLLPGQTDLLKIDIEGAEFAVLEDLERAGSFPRIEAIQLEYHYIPGFQTRSIGALLAILDRAGYRTFVESHTPPHRVLGTSGWSTSMVYAWRAPSLR